MYTIKEIFSKEMFDRGLSLIPQENRHFLQSYEYGQMQNDLGHKPFYLGFFNGEKIAESLLIISFKAKRGHFLFCPYGIFDQDKLNALMPFLRKLAKKEKVDFIRLSPLMGDTQENRQLFATFKFKDAPVHMMHPEIDWCLDISKDENALLKNMRKNNRYSINKAEKDGVEIKSAATREMLEEFYNIHQETALRQKFIPWSKKSLISQLEHFGPIDQIKVYLGYYENKAIAGAVIMFYHGRAYYHHGASLSEYQKIPASYLIQWEAIKEAKKRGFKDYSFYGIVENMPKHPWAGLSFFKQGFGGEARHIIHCQDLPLSWKYWLNFVVEKARRIKRGY